MALIHIANAIYLVSYLVKDILWLRLLTVAGGLFLFAYYVLLPEPMLVAIGWNVVFLLINGYQIYALFLERRPVLLSHDDQRLHKLAFRSLTPRELVRLARLGTWVTATDGERIVSRGTELDRMWVLFSGGAVVKVDDRVVSELRPGQFIGEMSFLTGAAPSADVEAVGATRLLSWKKDALRRFLEHSPALRAAWQDVLGADLVVKLRAS